MTQAITILDVALARGAKKDPGTDSIPQDEFRRVGVAMIGGCQVCQATIAAYNAHPSKSGFWKCQDCIVDTGFATVAEFEKESRS